jgi:hypothetical protein
VKAPNIAIIGFLLSLILLTGAANRSAGGGWKAGVAIRDITPQESIWLGGFGNRTRQSEGISQRLHAKALALEDRRGERLVIVTTDLLGFTRAIADPIVSRLAREAHLKRRSLILTSSHTHSGPVIRDYSVFAYGLNPEQTTAIERYSSFLENQVVAAVMAALKDLSPARIRVGEGSAGFGVNRRLAINPAGPVDPSVPVMQVESVAADGFAGKARAILFSYACHNTTLVGDSYQVHGDYAGVAQESLEKAHPEASALFMAGCGGDINPLPRGTVELVEKYGRQLAASVENVLQGPMRNVEGTLSTAFEIVNLRWAPPPSKEEWQRRAQSPEAPRRRHALRMLDIIQQHGRLPEHYPYPVQVASFGSTVVLVALGGEVVVDYPLRLRRELASYPLWVVSYSNDVMGYIPSLRVLKEGGYEGGGAMTFYGRPGPWAPDVEERVVGAVKDLVPKTTRKTFNGIVKSPRP